MMKKFKDIIEDMKNMADQLVPYTYPKVPYQEEQDILLLKQSTLVVDGYEVGLCFSKADYDDYFLLTIQIQSSQSPFLPFNLVCKIGRAFLGSKNLSYVEFLKGNNKVYCWIIKTDKEYNSYPPVEETKYGSYEGFEFRILHPSSMDLF